MPKREAKISLRHRLTSEIAADTLLFLKGLNCNVPNAAIENLAEVTIHSATISAAATGGAFGRGTLVIDCDGTHHRHCAAA